VITVLDFGMGNLRSVSKALERAGAEVSVSADIDPAAEALVVPGQGHFGSCVVNLGARFDEVRAWIDSGKPYLGLCLGLQVLFEGSDEDPGSPGMGVLPGVVRKLPDGLKVPHIGWNEVTPVAGLKMFEGIAPGTRFYFVHSFYPDTTEVAATTEYGITFPCAAVHGNVFATQFHPEKSGDAGAAMLRNFVNGLAA
jgi:imidazole glycerol phosphate synthase glutamine amidotransferase subunit